MNMGQKIRAIRKAEGLTQAKFCEIIGMALSTLKNYEGGHAEPGLQSIMLLTKCRQFEKYTLWLMTDKTAEEAGQIAPALAHIGPDSAQSDPSEKQTG
ncbi:helix-turn-helix domain-containing protein [Pectobacterium aroidearum]|uniref:helix-turn-helix domain-containing protein n=1 Tax=Pectobacterium aroidearum TaxID=1201031 RepID=UPI002113CEDD|nr:helix-turn-helix transcriptional regulator [Pectobacterium aroidearum]UUE36535.1 helix-turn-helix domain-containing protein [Pectobacterium aroidearum]UUE40911.1 helix-turn-helix domain-containing protein [Pectobacterium aroidearum]